MVIKMNDKNSKSNLWYKIDVILKALGAIIISGVIALVGIFLNQKQSQISEANRQAQILIQTMNQREISSSNMRAQMFNTLMQNYFNGQEDETTQVAVLELIGLNFQDHIHLKPLFERLDKKLTEKTEQRRALRKAANRIKRIEVTTRLARLGVERGSIMLISCCRGKRSL